jgi:glycine dehydrogenase subunit 2
MKLIFEKSIPGRAGVQLPSQDTPVLNDILPKSLIRADTNLPEVGEVDVVRHYIGLSKMNYGVDNGFYPLGSCTMKYNPKINEITSSMPGFAYAHPLQPEELSQGALRLMHELEKDLCEITGFRRFSLQPAAGAQGELTGIMIIQAFFRKKGRPAPRYL